MLCKTCHNEIPDGSIYCNWCGVKQTKARKKKAEVKVPQPKQLPSGKWRIQLRAEGLSITEDTPELCTARAKAIRTGLIEAKKAPKSVTLSDAINRYIERRDQVLSPSTVRGYRIIQRNRFQGQMLQNIHDNIDWQDAVNKESKTCSPKTLKNAWRFICSVLRDNGETPPKVRLPQVAPNEKPWLDDEEVLKFIAAIKDEPCETAALLALHSLRRSELCGLRWRDVDLKKKTIHINGALVPNASQKFIRKETTKNTASNRMIPIMIPRLVQILSSEAKGKASNEIIIQYNPNTIRRQINRACISAGLPQTSVHGLRRSFASLAYHLGWREEETMAVGGWSDFKTVHDVYIKLSTKDKKRSQKKMERFYSNI